jgi:D-3-phosphoglycerate dehydrogenase
LNIRAIYYRVLGYQPENVSLLQATFDVTALDDPRQDTDQILADAEVLFAPLGFQVDADRIQRCPRLRVVVSNTTGVPHIDMNECRRRQVVVCALHDEPAFLESVTPTAEHTIGLMMAVWRRIPAAHVAAASGCWDRRPWGAPRMLSRMRLGIVGYGRLGRRVDRVGRALDMSVDYYDPYVTGGADSLLTLTAKSDVLSLHAPLNEETQNLISRRALESLPSGAIVINTARGELLDSEALIDLIESGHLAGAGLDTVPGEYDVSFSDSFAESRVAWYARHSDRLILTPHIGGSTIDAWRETERRVIQKACKALGLEEVS